jgi:16S rRNA (adenine1518-N6/adenine1519-N6)-dimethyltransferase
MQTSDYIKAIRDLGARKSMGQSFLINGSIAEMEAKYAKGMNVVELGPGMGILTRELCSNAKRVIAVEKDTRLFDILKNELKSKKLELINDDFFEVDFGRLSKIDIMVSNIPYVLSSKVIYWISAKNIPALICIQKEFASHMLAEPGTRDYSKLSVISALSFKSHFIREVHAGNFYPKPRVDSSIVYLAPKDAAIEDDVMSIISQIMNHKKKRLRNAVIDSASGLGITKDKAKRLSSTIDNPDSRPFQLEAQKILDISRQISKMLLDQKE